MVAIVTKPPSPQLRVLFFDVFGTCVAQRGPIADALWAAAQEALQADASSPSMNRDVRRKAEQMSYEQWFEFGGEWNKDIDVPVKESIALRGNVDWRAIDAYRAVSLCKLLTQHGLVLRPGPHEEVVSGLSVEQGSLWDAATLKRLALAWRRLTPWPDTCPGMDLLNKQFSTVALSNTYNEFLQSLVAHGGVPFAQLYSSDMFDSYKPNPKVYLGAAEKMGVKPEECALVAAHLGDLKGAKACGFYAIYVERPLEEKQPKLRDENIPDMWVKEDEEGFVALAQHLVTKSG